MHFCHQKVFKTNQKKKIFLLKLNFFYISGHCGASPSNSKNNRASPPSAKKHPKPKVEKGIGKPLVPWSQRNLGPPKNSNGWSWVGDGIEQKVYLNKLIIKKLQCHKYDLHQ